MAKRKNPSTLTWLLLLGGGGAVALYLMSRRKNAVVAAVPPPAVLEPPAAEQEPAPEEVSPATTCYEEDRPIDEPGYEWRCIVSKISGAQWKKRRIKRRVAPGFATGTLTPVTSTRTSATSPHMPWR